MLVRRAAGFLIRRALALRALACLSVVVGVACGRSDSDATRTEDTSPPAAAESAVHRPEELVAAAMDLVGFLRGQVPFSRLRLADTVTLRLGIEEGGTMRRVARERLREPSAWSVKSLNGGFTYAFAPHPSLTSVETRVGRHVRCMDHDLTATDPELGALPHVGVVLSPPDFSSCLQTWNLTIVFDAALKPPTVVAVIYDQFEW